MNLKRTKHSFWTVPENWKSGVSVWIGFSSWKNARRDGSNYNCRVSVDVSSCPFPHLLYQLRSKNKRLHPVSRPTPEHYPVLSPAPAKEGWDGHPDTNGPSNQNHHQCMLGGEADVAKGLTDDDVALKSQESQ